MKLSGRELDKKLDYDLKKYFGKENFRENQKEIIKALCRGRDVIAVMPTGGGKSLCYQLAGMEMDGAVIVVTPLIELMRDQVKNLKETLRKNAGISARAVCINSENSSDIKNIEKYKFIYVSPERLYMPKFIHRIRKMNISMIVLDEAHCISMWGYDFRPAYLKISRFISMLEDRPVLSAFTATATKFIKEDIKHILGLRKPFELFADSLRTNLYTDVMLRKTDNEKLRSMYSYIYKSERMRQETGKGLIFCTTKEKTDEIYNKLKRFTEKNKKVNHCGVFRYHAGMTKEERNENSSGYSESHCGIMVATNAYGMGIDIPDIRYVIHYNMPKDIESYYQEIGRAGRDGKPARCVLYCGRDDWKICLSLIAKEYDDLDISENIARLKRKQTLKRLWEMRKYCHIKMTSDERALWIKRYFENETPLVKGDFSYRPFDEPEVIYMNTSKIAYMIRKGEYETGKFIAADSGGGRTDEFLLSDRLTYFDMMTADAVYTLFFMNKKRIYPKTVMEILSGDPDITLDTNKKRLVEESLEKMMNADITIKCHDGNVFNGKFLPIEKYSEGRGYICKEIPPLYSFAEYRNGQFFIIPLKELRISDGRKYMPNTVENIMLKYYIAWHIKLSSPARVLIRRKRTAAYRKAPTMMSQFIAFSHRKKERKGLFDILSISMPDDIYKAKRKKRETYQKIKLILDNYVRADKISSYEPTDFTGDENRVKITYRQFKNNTNI